MRNDRMSRSDPAVPAGRNPGPPTVPPPLFIRTIQRKAFSEAAGAFDQIGHDDHLGPS